MKHIYFILAFCAQIPLLAQVGIGTSTPNGILDIESTQYGIVYPSVTLTATNTPNPVLNPNEEALEAGTTVYNPNTTTTGSNDVEPGIYAWDGTRWIPHFEIKQVEIYEQSSTLRSSSSSGFEDVPGLGVADNNSILALNTGTYRIEVRVNFGGGQMTNNGDINVAVVEGDFDFVFDGTTHTITMRSASSYNNHISGGTNFTNIWSQSAEVIYIDLVAGQTYDFSLQFDQYDAPGLLSNGDNILGNDGRGYVGADIPCFIEFTYIGTN